MSDGPGFRFGKRARLITLGVLSIPFVGAAIGWAYIVRMPGSSYEGALPALTEEEREVARETRRHVEELATRIGERNHTQPEAMKKTVAYIEREFSRQGYEVNKQSFEAVGQSFDNVEVVLTGSERPDEVLVIGAHYDAALDCPAANDNGSGVAALLVLARDFKETPQPQTVRFVAFANEEPPHFKNKSMGSLHYANRAGKNGDRITAMLSLETMGYYRDDEGTQKYPFPFSLFYPSQGDFIGFVGDASSRALLHETITTFRDNTKFPSQGAALPRNVPGAGWSDHWSFWQNGYPAVMITDTAPFRYPHYHEPTDTADQLDYERLARVVVGLKPVVRQLSR